MKLIKKNFIHFISLFIFIFVIIVSCSLQSSTSLEQSFLEWVFRCTEGAKDQLCTIVETAESVPLQLIFVFILGILMSFTPCIYPMIPITVGVIQANSASTFWSNFKLSFAYTLGMALTFAIFGLVAALSGSVFGQLLASPAFVVFFVIVLAYLAFSMFGFYEISIPRFLMPRHSRQSKGSLISSFLFGAASGTFASPCLSPGLALLLSMVATLGNKLLGFTLLFVFGLGTSLPLLIVGTFSGSLNMLPRAGMWMLEVKKIFGIMLIGMCFYYLSNILPSSLTLALLALSMFISGIYYFSGSQADRGWLKWFKDAMGFFLICGSLFISWQSFKEYTQVSSQDKETLFTTSYHEAITQAQNENKKLFLDFGASYCTSCTYIQKKILSTSVVQEVLKECIPVYIDGTHSSGQPFADLRKKYEIIGFPTYLLIEKDGNLIKRWGPEIAHVTPTAFAEELHRVIKNEKTI